jgi:hypothetical protein
VNTQRFLKITCLLLLLGLPKVVQAQVAYSTNADGSVYAYSTNADGSVTILDYGGPPWAVTIPTNINGLPVTSIGDAAFFENGSLTSFTIGNSVTSLGDDIFTYCENLTNVTIGNSVTNIGDFDFEYCSNLTSVTIGNSVTSVGGEAFQYCRGLTSITIPNSVTNIGNSAFYFCTALTNVTIGTNVTSIEDYAFDGTSLIRLTIPNSVTSIGYMTFEDISVAQLIIPNSVTSIGEYAFAASGLINVTIGNGVTNIGDYAFGGCTRLTRVYFQGNSPTPTNDTSVFSREPATVYYLPGTIGWGTTFDGIPAVLWNPQAQRNASFGVKTNQFGFNITGSSNLVVVVESCTNLANPVWTPVSTNTLNTFVGTNGTSYFSDPQWTNYPARFYGFSFP